MNKDHVFDRLFKAIFLVCVRPRVKVEERTQYQRGAMSGQSPLQVIKNHERVVSLKACHLFHYYIFFD